MKYGTGKYTYEVVPHWGEEAFRSWDMSSIPGVITDDHDNVYVLCRNESKIAVLNQHGQLLREFGKGLCGRLHYAGLSPDHFLFVVDESRHVVHKIDPDTGTLIMTLGTLDQPSDTGCPGRDYRTVTHGGPPFHNPTGITFVKNGSFYISDGYGNSRIHYFDKEGNLQMSWGEPGDGPGLFHLPHDAVLSPDETIVYVADRENNRIQLFNREGQYLDQWTGLIRPCGIAIRDSIVYVAELSRCGEFDGTPSTVCLLDLNGKIITRLEAHPRSKIENSEPYRASHGIAVDSQGSIYIGEIGKNQNKRHFALIKLQRI